MSFRDDEFGNFLFTLFLVHAQDDDDLVPADSDQLLDRSDATTREFREQDHSLDVVILELINVFVPCAL